jgi:RNA polymerase sigma factor (sigma-70 family)
MMWLEGSGAEAGIVAFGPSNQQPYAPERNRKKFVVKEAVIMNNPRSKRLLAPGTRATLAWSPKVQPTASRIATGGQGADGAASADSFVDKYEALFLSNLPLIDDVTGHVCRRHRLDAADTDDFRSDVHVHFIERNYEVLRRFEGRSSLRTYVTVVIHRLFLDRRNRAWGKWRPSVDAKRLGPIGILLERYVVCDGWSIEQAVELLRVNHSVEVDERLKALTVKLSQRPPARQLRPEEEASELESPGPLPEVIVLRAEQDFLAKRLQTALERARQTLAPEDRLILRMRYEDGILVADIARALHVNQKRLYRTIDRLLADLYRRLEADGISRRDAMALLADGGLDAGRVESAPVNAGDVATPQTERTRTLWQQKR